MGSCQELAKQQAAVEEERRRIEVEKRVLADYERARGCWVHAYRLSFGDTRAHHRTIDFTSGIWVKVSNDHPNKHLDALLSWTSWRGDEIHPRWPIDVTFCPRGIPPNAPIWIRGKGYNIKTGEELPGDYTILGERAADINVKEKPMNETKKGFVRSYIEPMGGEGRAFCFIFMCFAIALTIIWCVTAHIYNTNWAKAEEAKAKAVQAKYDFFYSDPEAFRAHQKELVFKKLDAMKSAHELLLKTDGAQWGNPYSRQINEITNAIIALELEQ